jgi:hypothetical protein
MKTRVERRMRMRRRSAQPWNSLSMVLKVEAGEEAREEGTRRPQIWMWKTLKAAKAVKVAIAVATKALCGRRWSCR